MRKSTAPALLVQQCAEADTIPKLIEVVRKELDQFDGYAEFVCGPITAGQSENTEENPALFNELLKRLVGGGAPIFDQRPFEARISELCAKWCKEDPDREDQCHELVLKEFYDELFSTGVFKKAYSIPGNTSEEARWKQTKLYILGAEIYLLPKGYMETVKGSL